MRSSMLALSIVLLAFITLPPLGAEDRAALVRKDLENVLAGGRWIYNDLPKGFADAKKTGKPLLVVFR